MDPQGTTNCINQTFPLQQYSCEIGHIQIYTPAIYWRHIIHLYQTMVENGNFGYEGQLPTLDTATEQIETQADRNSLNNLIGPIKPHEYDSIFGWGESKEKPESKPDTSGTAPIGREYCVSTYEGYQGTVHLGELQQGSVVEIKGVKYEVVGSNLHQTNRETY